MTQNAPKTLPANIGLDKYAHIGFHWQGVMNVHQFERLTQDVLEDTLLSLTVDFARQEGILWLSYDIQGVLSVACQRCLLPLSVDVSGQYRMAIITHEDELSKVEGCEFILLSELGNPTHLPIKDLLEDELILQLPLSPRHEDCQLLTDSAGDIEQVDNDNPFAILASLKNKPS